MQPGGMPDLTQIVLKAQQMGDAVQRAQADLAQQTFAGSAGGNLVRAEVTGEGELTSVQIDPGALPADGIGADDLETLGDLVVAAVRDAQRQLADRRDEIVGEATGGFDLGALGLGDLGLPGPPEPPGHGGYGGGRTELPGER